MGFEGEKFGINSSGMGDLGLDLGLILAWILQGGNWDLGGNLGLNLGMNSLRWRILGLNFGDEFLGVENFGMKSRMEFRANPERPQTPQGFFGSRDWDHSQLSQLMRSFPVVPLGSFPIFRAPPSGISSLWLWFLGSISLESVTGSGGAGSGIPGIWGRFSGFGVDLGSFETINLGSLIWDTWGIFCDNLRKFIRHHLGYLGIIWGKFGIIWDN